MKKIKNIDPIKTLLNTSTNNSNNTSRIENNTAKVQNCEALRDFLTC
jgi:hypothetical protein